MVKPIDGRGIVIPRTEQRDIRSRAGREYRILIAKPFEEPPSGGYPVIYVLDANAIFLTALEAERIQRNRPGKTGIVAPSVIVGIGYPSEKPFDPARCYDYTMPTPNPPKKPDGTVWPELGGADAFLKFIEEELKPEIEREFKIDSSKQTIFGHSLGGLFVLNTLFTKPEAFQTYVAGSPSIHWNKPYILEKEKQFADRLNREKINVGVLTAVGELERANNQRRMVENVQELSERLKTLSGRGVHVEFKVYEGENHVGILPALISRTLRFSLRSAAPAEQ